MKILFTSVGRRVELIQAFQKAAEGLGEDLTVIGGDFSDTAPARYAGTCPDPARYDG